MKKGLLFLILSVFLINTSSAQLIISQYYEGSSNNKWIEITNTTNGSLDLTGYYVCNFNSNLTSPTACVSLSGMISSNEALLVRHSSANAPSYATASFVGGCSFNGNDKVVLTISNSGATCYSNRIDEIGHDDPGGSNWGQNKSFYRNASVNLPNTTYTSGEWTEVSNTTVDNAGAASTERLGVHIVSTLLPINLTTFTATKKAQTTYLQWQTATEINNDYMAIERSSNGRDFEEITRVKGAGTTYEAQSYEYTDAAPLAGINYYRLRQVDFDGKATLHNTVSVTFDKEEGVVRIIPTEAASEVMVYLPEQVRQAAQLRVYDLTGQLWMNQTLNRGTQERQIDVSALPQGHYFLQLIDGNAVETVRFNKI